MFTQEVDMRRTEWLQETRMIRFEEAFFGWTENRLSPEEAARLLGVCGRTFRRYVCRYEEHGIEGLVDKRLTQVSHRKAPLDEGAGRGQPQLHLGQGPPPGGQADPEGPPARRPPEATGEGSLAGHDAPSGRKYPPGGPRAAVGPHPDHGRRPREAVL